MKDAGFLYVVRFWIEPKMREAVMNWLEGGHVEEVVSQPGFLWCRRADLKEKDDHEWEAHSMVYGIESRDAFEAYSANSELTAKFAREREPFSESLRMERFGGEVTLAVDK
jgi:hypothetical protein